MTLEKLIFYVLAAVVLAAAVMVVTRRNPVHSALFLILAFFASSGIWLLAEAEFLAIVLVLVYVGAVMVLFLFVLMMLDIDIAVLRSGFIKLLPLGLVMAIAMAAELILIVGPDNFGLEKICCSGQTCRRLQQYRRAWQCTLHRLHVPLRGGCRDFAGGDHRSDWVDHAAAYRYQVYRSFYPGCNQEGGRSNPDGLHGRGKRLTT